MQLVLQVEFSDQGSTHDADRPVIVLCVRCFAVSVAVLPQLIVEERDYANDEINGSDQRDQAQGPSSIAFHRRRIGVYNNPGQAAQQ